MSSSVRKDDLRPYDELTRKQVEEEIREIIPKDWSEDKIRAYISYFYENIVLGSSFPNYEERLLQIKEEHLAELEH